MPSRFARPQDGRVAIGPTPTGLAATADELLDFFADRLKVQQREAGVRHDLIDAVFALGGEDDLVRLLARVKALQDFVETAEGSGPARRLQARRQHPQEGGLDRPASAVLA